MLNNRVPLLNKRFENSNMTFTAEAVRDEMRGLVSNVVALAPGNRKAAFAWTARYLRLPFSRVRTLYYGRAKRIDAHEADQIRAYVQAAAALLATREKLERDRADFLANHPSLAFAVPAAPRRTQLSEVATAVVAVADGTAERVGSLKEGE